MQYPMITLAVLLLPSALALPSINNGHGHGFKHEHKPHKSGAVSGAPFPSGTGGPFGLNNATSSAAGSDAGSALINTNTLYTTLHNTIYQTVPASATGGAPALSATAAFDSGAGSCAAPVTVTYNPTVTVTVGGSGAAPAESPVQPASVVSSSSAAIASASSAPEALETSAPPVSSVSPAVFSSTSAPKTSQAPVSTQAASSAPVASNVAPVQSVSASPIGLSPQPVPVSPSVVAASTASAVAGSPAAPVTGGVPGTKRGIAFVDGPAGTEADHLTQYVNAHTDKIKWLGNFFSAPPPNLKSSIEFVPQMYGLKSVDDWAKWGAQEYGKGDKFMFSFGEPETNNTDLHQDAPTAVSNWMKWMAPYAKNVTIGAPGVLQGTDDLKYLEAFLEGCKTNKPPCKLGFVALHWVYKADLSNVQGFKNAVNDAIVNATRPYDLPLWVDNIQAGGTSDQQIAFLDEIVPWLENNPEVYRYGYLPPAVGNPDGYATFLNPDGSPSDLAKHYATMPTM